MVQRLLTKYGLAFHIACICLYPLFFIGQTQTRGLVPLFWLSLIAIEWMFLIPAVRRGETFVDARQRVVSVLWRDPFLYIGLAFIGLVATQSFNSGCDLIYLFDADVWQLSQPPLSWAPFSIKQDASLTHLAIFTACLVTGIVLRVAVGKAAKHMLLKIFSWISGVFAWICVAFAFLGHEPWMLLATGTENTGVGVCFGFWLLLGMGLLAEALANNRRGYILFFLTGVLGNLLGMLCFSALLTLLVCAISAALLFAYCMIYLHPLVSKTTQIRLFLCTVVSVAAVVAGLVLFPQSPAAPKIEMVDSKTEYWEGFSVQNRVRSKAAMTIWQEHPWAGVGADGFYHMAGLAVEPEEWRLIEKDRDRVYNDCVQFLCEYGVFGIGLLFAALIILLISICYRARLVCENRSNDVEFDRSCLLRFSPIVISGGWAVLFCCLESFIASPFRSAVVLLSCVCVLASMPAFLPERPSEEAR